MTEHLKPCPFCGSAAVLEDNRLSWTARCPTCGARVMGERAPEPEEELPDSYWQPFRQSAIDRWNRRTALVQPEAERPSDEELMELMPETMDDEFDHAAATCSTATGGRVEPGIFRACLNRSALEYARLVLAWGRPAPAQPETEKIAIGPEWQPCVKLPITVHVREQRPGETHVSTREGITPVRADDLIMRGVQGEEYPIGRELFNKTYKMGKDQPETEGPSDDELLGLDELHAAWNAQADAVNTWDELGIDEIIWFAQQQALARWGHPTPEPVPVSERPWEREGWCGEGGMLWAWNSEVMWWDWLTFKFVAWNADDPYTHCLPCWAIPLP